MVFKECSKGFGRFRGVEEVVKAGVWAAQGNELKGDAGEGKKVE